MLMCGFEKFDNYYVRIDILERLFLMIIDINNNNKDKEIKLEPDMLNLLGCNKENFIKLMEKMNYKSSSKGQDIYFKYNLKKKLRKINNNKNIDNDNPFKILKEMRLK